MFRIVKQPRAWWPVTWKSVDEDGNVVENRIQMQFRLLKVDDFVRLMAEAAEVQDAAAQADGAESASTTFARVIERIAEDWRDVAGENGVALPWTTENLALLMNEPRLFDRVLAAFRECLGGGDQVRQGN